MKVAIYDRDVAMAAQLAFALKRACGQGTEVVYCERIDDAALSTSTLVIADPEPLSTVEWLMSFRELHPSATLLLVSANTDLLSGSMRDLCYASSKPVDFGMVLSVLKSAQLGQIVAGGPLTRTEKRAN